MVGELLRTWFPSGLIVFPQDVADQIYPGGYAVAGTLLSYEHLIILYQFLLYHCLKFQALLLLELGSHILFPVQ